MIGEQEANMIHQLQAAAIAARRATGDRNIGIQAHSGIVDIVRAVPPASGVGKYSVTILLANLTPSDAVRELLGMRRS